MVMEKMDTHPFTGAPLETVILNVYDVVKDKEQATNYDKIQRRINLSAM
jgi:hypothetical protein